MIKIRPFNHFNINPPLKNKIEFINKPPLRTHNIMVQFQPYRIWTQFELRDVYSHQL